MLWTIISTLLLLAPFCDVSGRNSHRASCKDPPVAQRFLADDVRAASPFYVLALPRNYKTKDIDNVCYTYFETGGSDFFHIISVTYKNGHNEYYRFLKGDIPGQEGVAEGKALGSSPCTYHDYTLTNMPCNNTVFILYRCFLQGNPHLPGGFTYNTKGRLSTHMPPDTATQTDLLCPGGYILPETIGCKNIDIGRNKGVDVRVALAVSPKQKQDCLTELKMYFKDTTSTFRGDYVILPQVLRPQCVTKYNDIYSIGYQRAAGSKEVAGPDLHDIFIGDEGNIYRL